MAAAAARKSSHMAAATGTSTASSVARLQSTLQEVLAVLHFPCQAAATG